MEKTFNYSINDGFLWSEVNLKGEKQFFIEGYASTIDQDKAGEILEFSAQEDIFKQVQNENITMDIEHEEWYSNDGKVLQRPKNEKIPVAKIVSAELRPRGVWVKAQINTNLRSFNEVWGSIKDGFLKAFSVAFYPVQKVGGIIKHLNLVNITLTGSPVNPQATFAVSMKSAAAWMDTLEIPKEEIKMVEEIKTEVAPEIKAEPVAVAVVAPTESVEAIVKAMKDKHEAEMTAMKELMTTEIAGLKAELAKPVMKAIVEEVPKEKPVFQAVSPLQLVR
jgi:phage head maturation protease